MTTEIIPSGILNTKKSDYGNTPLFLGEQPGVFDTIHIQHPQLVKLYKTMKSLDWDENEWDHSEAIDDFKHQPKYISDMMIETFTFQWDLDTFAGRISALVGLFNPCSELWRAWQRLSEMEVTHAASYSEIARNAFENPREVLETVLNNQEAFTRMAVVGREMEKIRQRGLQFQLGLVPNDQETFNAAFMFTYMMLLLERVQFMSSFAVTFAIGEMGIFNPVVNTIKRICTDEWEHHVELDWYVLKELMTTTEGQTAYTQCKGLMQEVLDEVVEAERAWTQHIFRHGQRLPKLDVEGLLKWVDYSATAVAIPLGLTVKNELRTNPLPYMVDWINISDTQQSPQEETSGQYKQNNLTRDDSETDFSAYDDF